MSLGKNKILQQAGAAAPTDVIDIDNFNLTTYDTFNPSEIGIYTGGGCTFSADGSKFYAAQEYTAGIVYQYNTPGTFELPADGTADTTNKNLNGSYMYQCLFNNNGTKFFAWEYFSSTDRRFQGYNLSSAYNIGTASINTGNAIDKNTMSAKVSNFEQNIGSTFNSDGTSFYTHFGRTDATRQFLFHRYDLSTAYDISGVDSASADSASGGITTTETYDSGRGMWVNESETQIIISNSTGIVHQFDMTTAGDLSTISLTKIRNFGIGNAGDFQYWPDAQVASLAGDGSSKYYLFDYEP